MSAPTVDDLQVVGGAGGTSAELEALDALARALAAHADALGAAALAVAGAATSPDLLASAALAPRGAGEAAAHLAGCSADLLALAGEVDAVAVAVRGAVAAYRSWEGATSTAVESLRQDLGGVVLWAAVPAVLVVGGALVAGEAVDVGVASWAAGREAQARALAGGASRQDAAALGRSVQEQAWSAGVAAARGRAGAAAEDAWESLGPHRDEVAELTVDALVGATGGSLDAPAVARLWARVGFDQGVATQARPVGSPTVGVAPARTVGDMVRRAGDLKADVAAEPGSVRVDRTPGAAGAPARVVVYLPATQRGIHAGGTNPADMETNLRAVGGERTAVATGTIAAMRQAGVRPGDQVAFVGFSQGGLTAAELAGDPEVRAMCEPRVVLTAGSPTATSDAPPGVTLLSLEHDGDEMAALDGAPNPDLPAWTTVHAPPGGTPHDASTYGRTGDLVSASADPSLVAFGAAVAPFLATGATTTSSTYQLVRDVPAAAPPARPATAAARAAGVAAAPAAPPVGGVR